MPISTQKTLRMEYARSFLSMEHHDSKSASRVLNTQTNRKGLAGPNQLTRLKLEMRMRMPIISRVRMCFKMKVFTAICPFVEEWKLSRLLRRSVRLV